jgi:hypothetical protein
LVSAALGERAVRPRSWPPFSSSPCAPVTLLAPRRRPAAQELDLAEIEMPGLMQCRTKYAGSLA